MNIPINKDFEREYQEDVWRGFSLRQLIFLGIGVCIGASIVLFAYFYLGFPIQACVYLGVPAMAPALVAGFYTYQGMTILEYVKVILYEKKTEVLIWEAGEMICPDLKTQSKLTCSEKRKKRKRRRQTVKRKRQYLRMSKKRKKKGGDSHGDYE